VDAYRANESVEAEAKAGLDARLADEQANQKDIFMYLNGELAKKTDEILELQEKVQALLDENEKQTLEHESRMLAQKDAAQLQAAKLQEDVAFYKQKLDTMNKFISEKAEMEANLEQMERKIEDDAKAHAVQISDLERKHVQEKDRLKTEMLYKLRETKANLLKMTDNQLDTTTKRTIAENEQMSSELAWQSKETEKLIRKNDKLMTENASLKRELSLHKQTQEEFARKVNVYQKTIQTLMAKLSSVGSEHESELQKRDLQAEDAERDRADGLQERQTMAGQLADAQERLDAAEGAALSLEEQLREAESKHANVLMLQDDATKFTLQCLDDVRKRQRATSPASPNEGSDESNEPLTLRTLDPSKREAVLSYLLEQLSAYQEQLKELALQTAWRERTQAAARPPSGSTPHLPPIPHRASPGAAAANQAAVWSVGPPPQVPTGAGGGGAGGGGFGGSGAATELNVREPVRPWGRRVKETGLPRR